MDNKEITALFTFVWLMSPSSLVLTMCSGYGYQVRIVEDLHHIDDDLAASMDWALAEIKKIQKAARSGKPIVKPRWPVLILRTPKVYHHLIFPLTVVLITSCTYRRAGRVQNR
jgi:xylulose-5-phosphate/fructose-6-phosphate phosphoketolase